MFTESQCITLAFQQAASTTKAFLLGDTEMAQQGGALELPFWFCAVALFTKKCVTWWLITK